ncbi:cupin domain-containing protein [Chelativorans sp. SCAU2101]|jgi:Uncharacterized protein containing double-stranded beta helix domain|uniref:Cupin domain-containing protein n=1 Tax=Chelativorans petroleitrophicus TaxID=2975484 RepID=A0A9X2XBL0_9HYPH|nr:cupin domain-containing protein [Chelativorans petroleitrophicus]MCT8991694.1 cupin domain-containing protein [Chelativorans petroleitrophicus]
MTNVIEPRILHLEEDVEMPNHPSFPVLIYAGVFAQDEAGMDRAFEERFAQNGWRGIWRNGIFGYHHFHPDAHEALGVARGSAEVQLGGESGERLRIEVGDLLVLPAGTGHKRLSASADFLVVGAYPKGQENYTILRSKVPRDVVAQVPRPRTDPFYGNDGPLLRLW